MAALFQVLRLSFPLYVRKATKYHGKIDPHPSSYGGKANVTVMPGVGIGPEVIGHTLEVLNAVQAPLNYEIVEISSGEHQEGEFENLVMAIKRNKVAIKANIEIKSKDPMVLSRSAALRQRLDLHAYILLAKTFPGLRNTFGDIDVVLIRQNTEGEYLMLEHTPIPTAAESLKIVSKHNSSRIAEFAFKYAEDNKRKHITVVHTMDIQPQTEGLFVEGVLEVQDKFPNVELKVMECGTALLNLIRRPSDFDILLASNLNGNQIGAFLTGMCGGPGLTSGMHMGTDGIAVFEAGARNKGSSIVGKGIANPIATFLCAARLLDFLKCREKSEVIHSAIFKTLSYDRVFTPDMGGTAKTSDITESVINHIKASKVIARKGWLPE